MHTPLVLALFALAAPLQQPQAQPTGVIRGTIVSATTGRPLAFAVVELIGTGRPVRVIADSTGTYRLEDVPAGRLRLRASHVDHAPLEVEVLVPDRATLALGFALEIQPIALPPVAARAPQPGGLADSTAAAPSTLTPATVRALEATPGMAELGLGDMMSGDGSAGGTGHEPPDPSNVLFIRGATADLKRVLLDGAPVYTPFHVAGLIPPFEPGLLSAAGLHMGGAPARYDGGLSYILDLRTRAAGRDGIHAVASADLLAANAHIEGPLTERGGFVAAVRALHPLAGALFSSEAFPYEYADGLVRADLDVGDEGVIGTTAFWNREAVALDGVGGRTDEARWGNAAGSIRYQGPFAGATARFVAAFSGYHARLPIQDTVLTRGVVKQVRLAGDFSRPAGPVELRFGAAYERLSLRYDAWSRAVATAEPLAEATATGDVAGAYVDVDWRVAPRVRLRGGVRADHFSLDGGLRFAPRLSATWLMTDRAALTLAAGRYHQYVRVPEPVLAEPALAPAAFAGGDSIGALQAPLTVAGASHVVLTLEQQLGDDIGLGLEGFFKRFNGMPAVERTRARASGVDVWLRRTGAGITGWAGYSLAWVWSLPDQAGTSEIFSGRQLLSAGLAGPLGSDSRFELGIAYGAGLPYSAIPTVGRAADSEAALSSASVTSAEGSLQTAAPDEPYLRLDLELSHTWTPRWRGIDFTVTPYLKVLNALDRRDALFYQFDPDQDTEPRPLGTLPVLPVLGMRWSF